jgi:hypothetical protein
VVAHGVSVGLGDAEVEFARDVAQRGESGKERSDGVLKARELGVCLHVFLQSEGSVAHPLLKFVP